MNLGQLRTQVANRIDETITASTLNNWINSAYQRVALKSDIKWSWLQASTTFNTVADQKAYTKSGIASDLGTIYDIRHNDGTLKSLSQREFDKVVPNPTATGKPTYYTEWGTSIDLYPIPSSIISCSVRYFKDITELTNDSDEPIIPSKYHEILILGAMMIYYENDEDTTRLDRKVAEFNDYLKKMADKDETDSDRTYRLKPAKNYEAFASWDYN